MGSGVSVIVPVHNESPFLREVLSKIPPEYEVVLVDDGSTDKTLDVVQGFKIKIVPLPSAIGKSKALRNGLDLSTQGIVVFMDGDGQHDPSFIPALVEPILSGAADVVIGNRFSRGYAGTPPLRVLSNYLARTLIGMAAKDPVPDPLCGFRAFRREIILGADFGSGFDVEVKTLFYSMSKGFRTSAVPIPLIYGVEDSGLGFWDNFRLCFVFIFGFLVYMLRI